MELRLFMVPVDLKLLLLLYSGAAPVHGASGSEAALAATYIVELCLFMMPVDLKLLLLLHM